MTQASSLQLADYDQPPQVPDQVVTRKPSGGAKVDAPARRAALEDAVDWSLWIEAREAAAVLGKDADHFLKKVRKSLADRGMAMRAKGPEGSGQARWWIKRDYDLRLHQGPVGAATRISEDFFKLSEKHRNQAMSRAACVKRYRAMLTTPGSGPRSRWIDGLLAALKADFPKLKISERSLYRWHGMFNNEADLVKLADRRGGARNGSIDPAAWQYFRDLYLHPNQRSMKLCHDLTCDQAETNDWDWHPRTKAGYTKTVRKVRVELPHVTRVQARDPERYRNTMSPHMVMDPDAFKPGERWQGDHCVLDLFCLFPGSGGGRVGRPWLTAWLDTRTRKCVGWELCESPSSETIRSAFAKGMRDPSNRGGPAIVHIDNGKDYKCDAFTGSKFTKQKTLLKRGYADKPEIKGLYGLLEIDTIFAIPKNSRGKGHVEKWFDYSIHQRFDKLWDSYAGKDPASRPPGLQAKLKNKTSLPTFEEIRQAIAIHIAAYNDDAEHSKRDMAGRSPNAIMMQADERVLADPGVLDFMELTFTSPRRVNRHAVSISHQGKTLRYTSTNSAFLALTNTDKMVRIGYRQEDLFGQVYIFDAESMRLVCSADHERAGTSTFTQTGREDIKAAMAKQRRVTKATQVLMEESGAAVLPVEILAQREAIKRKAAEQEQNETTQGTGKRLVQTSLDGQSNTLRAHQLRKAAGAETSASTPRISIGDLTDRLAAKARVNTIVRTEQDEDDVLPPIRTGLSISERLAAKGKN